MHMIHVSMKSLNLNFRMINQSQRSNFIMAICIQNNRQLKESVSLVKMEDCSSIYFRIMDKVLKFRN